MNLKIQVKLLEVVSDFEQKEIQVYSNTVMVN